MEIMLRASVCPRLIDSDIDCLVKRISLPFVPFNELVLDWPKYQVTINQVIYVMAPREHFMAHVDIVTPKTAQFMLEDGWKRPGHE